MTFQRFALPVAAALLAGASAVSAQEIPSPGTAPETMPAPGSTAAPAPASADSACCLVPARTPIEIEMLDTVNSKDNRQGQNFSFRLAAPLTIDGHVVVPAGTSGVGEVVHADRARFGGRAGELILAARYLVHNGAHIPLRTLRFGAQQGRDSTGTVNALSMAAVATVPALALIGYMIAGGEVRVPAGTHASAQIANETRLAPVD